MAHARGLAVQGGFNDRRARGLIVQRLAPPSWGNLPNRPEALLEHPLAPQLRTVGRLTCSCAAIPALSCPARAAKIIRQRSATCCGVPCEASHCFSCLCSAASNLIARLVFGTTWIIAIVSPKSYLRDTTLVEAKHQLQLGRALGRWARYDLI